MKRCRSVLGLCALQSGADFQNQLVNFERFEQDGGETFTAGTNDAVVGIVTKTRRKDYRRGGVGRLGRGEHLVPALDGHLDVAEHEVERLMLDQLHRRRPVAGGIDLASVTRQHVTDGFPDYVFVVGQKNAAAFEERIAAIEGTEDAFATASGMAAVTTTLFAMLSRGAHVVVTDDSYRRTRQFLNQTLHRFGIECSTVPAGDYDAIAEAIRPTTRILLSESPTNPYNRILDLERFALKGVEVVDRHTYRVTVRGRYPQFVYWLAMPFFAPIPWEAERFYTQSGLAEKNITLDWYPVGTGPYMLTENDPNRVMILEKNPNFHGETYPSEGMPKDEQAGLLADAGKPLPFIDRVIFSRDKESIPRWNKFLQGYYDASGIGSDSFDQAVQLTGQGEATVTEAMKAQGIRLETEVATSTYYMGFNMLDPAVGGLSKSARKLRQAISIAVDYEEYVSIFANGRGIPAQGPIAPGIAGHRDGREGVNPVVYDWLHERPQRKPIAVAKALLAEAGYPNGMDAKTGAPLVLYFDVTARGADDKSSLDWMRKQFQKLNIQLVVRSTDYNRFQDKIRKGNAQIFEWGWNADYPDPENFLILLSGAERKVDNDGQNAANYDNPEYNRLFEQMKNMEDSPERQQIIDRMVTILRHDAPWLWGYHPKDYGLYHAWYGNVKPNKLSNNNIKYYRIDGSLREQKRREWNEPVLWPAVLGLLVLVASLVPAAIAYRRREQGTGTRQASPAVQEAGADNA